MLEVKFQTFVSTFARHFVETCTQVVSDSCLCFRTREPTGGFDSIQRPEAAAPQDVRLFSFFFLSFFLSVFLKLQHQSHECYNVLKHSCQTLHIFKLKVLLNTLTCPCFQIYMNRFPDIRNSPICLITIFLLLLLFINYS